VLACIAAGNVAQIAVQIRWLLLQEAAMHVFRGDAASAVGSADQRYQPVGKALRDIGIRGAVGYITDLRPGDDFFEGWYLAQYALAPIVVVSAARDFPYVIGNFTNAETDITRFPRLSPVAVYGDGLVLFRRTIR
jgi:hypothetical protein